MSKYQIGDAVEQGVISVVYEPDKLVVNPSDELQDIHVEEFSYDLEGDPYNYLESELKNIKEG